LAPSRLRAGIALSVLAFVVLFGYAVARPAIESLFLARHGSAALPWAWLGVALGATVAVAVYNPAAARWPLGRVLAGAVVASGVLLAALVELHATGAPGAAYLLYVWKDVHVVFLIEGLWSFANNVFREGTARWAYGVFCAAGSLGGIAGNLAVGPLARVLGGTAQALWVELLVLATAAAVTLVLARWAGDPRPEHADRGGLADGWRLLKGERTVRWLLALVVTVQVVITLVDYLFAAAVEAAYPDTDARTAFLGHVYAAVDGGALVLQLGTALVLRGLGLAGTLLAVPVVLGATLVAFAAVPRVLFVAAAKWASKALDYSLFRAAKEMLYIPLGYAAKTRGKALVDVLGYRVAKAAASLLVLALAGRGVIGLALALVAVWILTTLGAVRR
jgi:AAA family ATP:ADP antiporter